MMRFIIMHRTNAHWEAGARPDRELIARVGSMIGGLVRAGVLQGAEGLRPSSEGARLYHAGEARALVYGPFTESDNEPAAFTIVRAVSLKDAIAWAEREAEIFPGAEMDVRPLTEPWDIGMTARPADVTTRRYMILRKSAPATKGGDGPTASQRRAFTKVIAEAAGAGAHVVTETMRPGRRGRHYKNSRDGVSAYDGPFAETKELIGGYVIVSAESDTEADSRAREYIAAVGAEDVEMRELE